MVTQSNEAQAVAQEVLTALDTSTQIAPFSQRLPGFDLGRAYAATAALRSLRQARGDAHKGRKIGFTNRGMWEEYQVFAPIWGDMFGSTVMALTELPGAFELSALCEPKIEPEIAFGLARAPTPDMDEAALIGCVAWFAHGFEIVQSVYPGWKIAAADGVAGAGMHAALLLGPQHPVEDTGSALLTALKKFEVTLLRDGEVIDRGVGANVLDSPLTALRHLVALLGDDPHNPSLAAGEIITTGSLTRAFAVGPGERWSTEIRGLPISGISAAFA